MEAWPSVCKHEEDIQAFPQVRLGETCGAEGKNSQWQSDSEKQLYQERTELKSFLSESVWQVEIKHMELGTESLVLSSWLDIPALERRGREIGGSCRHFQSVIYDMTSCGLQQLVLSKDDQISLDTII